MKILITFAAALSLLFMSCSREPDYRSVSIDPDIIQVSAKDTHSNYEFRFEIYVIKYTYEGHWYQYHYRPSGYSSIGGVVHDIDCPCRKTKQNITIPVTNDSIH